METGTIELPTYTLYKEAEAEWLGVIPKHWQVLKMKYVFRDVSIKNRANAELLSVTQNQGVIPRSWVENRMVMPSGNLESFKFINEGDFAISLRSFEGGLEYCYHDGIISPAYTVLKAQKNIDGSYFKFLFKSSSFISELQTSIVGIREGKNISYGELCYSLIPIPPLSEQIAIANFLNKKTAQIDQAIAQKEKLIELLKERRQILIHKAVTRGLNPDVKMKDSGVEGLGDIPTYWDVIKFKYIIRTKARLGWKGLKASEYVDTSDYGFLSTPNIKGDRIDFAGAYFISERRYNESPEIMLQVDDVLLVKDGSTLGIVNIIRSLPFSCTVNSSIAVLRVIDSDKLFPSYLYYFLKSEYSQKVIELKKDGMGVPHLFQSDINNFIALLPPLDEQKSIAAYISGEMLRFLDAIRLNEKEIEKLKEYKATLINAAVTGKIKVNA